MQVNTSSEYGSTKKSLLETPICWAERKQKQSPGCDKFKT